MRQSRTAQQRRGSERLSPDVRAAIAEPESTRVRALAFPLQQRPSDGSMRA
jgi:hypothetical protein